MGADNTAVFPTAGFVNASNNNRFSGAFPDPYLDYASTQMPRSMYDVLRWCEYVWMTYGTYRTAVQRVVRYFLTQIELIDASDDEKEKYEKFLDEDLHIMDVLAHGGDNFMAYGNNFSYVRVPFRRYLRCPKCSLERPIGGVKYDFRDKKFRGKCGSPKCNHNGELQRVDRRSTEIDKLKVVHISPHEMKLMYYPIMDKMVYFWEIPAWLKAALKKGDHFYLETTPWEVIEAALDDHLFRFNDDVIYHMRETTLAGVRNFGWGIPRIMGNFKQAWLIQVMKRYNEAIALDYIIPFRVVTPQPGSSREGDPLLHGDMASFNSSVMAMFRMHRKDPTTLHALPFPVDMQMLGADAKNLAPTDLIDKATDEFLNAQGVPAEMYRGTLQWQAMPVAIRLFERTWVHFLTEMNNYLNWIFKRISEIQNWENLKGRLQPPTLADDMEQNQVKLQLAASQQISKQTAFAPFGINVREEVKKTMQEEQYQQEQMAKFQEEQQQKQELQRNMAQGAMGQPGQPGGQPGQPGGMPPGGPAGGAMGGNMPGAGTTPEDLTQQAEQIAYQMLGMPYEMRRSQLTKIKKANETLHSLVIAKMQSIRQEAGNQGGQQLLQQTLGGQSGM